MTDLAIMARKLALKHVAEDADRGLSEEYIRGTWHNAGRGHVGRWINDPDGFGGYHVGITGSGKVKVTMVCGVEGEWIFSLHELFLECRRGQVSLL
jgi:hypothetical protein